MSTKKHFVIDFDSTFTQVEALDVLGEISLDGRSDKAERLQKIKDITDQGMEGGLSFRESLVERLKLLDAHRDHLGPLVEALREKVSKSFRRNKVFFDNYADDVYILSNGFKDFIVPIVSEFGIRDKNVFANTFVFDEEGKIIGFDQI